MTARTLIAPVTALATAVVGATAAATPTRASNKRVAEQQAATLLARLSLPAGATRSATEPAGDAGLLAHPPLAQATPNLVDRHSWWIVPGRLHAVIAYVEMHRPAGSRLTVTSGGLTGPNTPANAFDGFDWKPVTHVLRSRELVVDAVLLRNGSTAVRADGEVIWITPRPRSEHIPAGATSLQLTIRRGNEIRQGPLTFTLLRQISKVVAVLNMLPASQPGTSSCPADTGVRMRLVLRRPPPRPPLADATVVLGGCGGVALTLDGHRQPALASGWFPGSGLPADFDLARQIQSVLGVTLNTSAI